jgi:hypothetical protein
MIVILMKKMLIFLFLLAAPVFAETPGILNFTYYNSTTGLFGYTVDTCNVTADCLGSWYKCFITLEDPPVAGTLGWCNSTAVTNCYRKKDNVEYVYETNTYYCPSNTTYRKCESGVWSGISNCTSGQTCVGGSTACSSPSTTTPSGSSSSANYSFRGSIIFSSFPSDFEITQGMNTTKTIVAKNNGNISLFNITLSLTGVDWYSVNPAKVATLYRNGETTFTIQFSSPADAEVKAQQLTFVLATSNASISTMRPLVMTVKPSNRTVQEQIFPDYTKYTTALEQLAINITSLENKGFDVTELRTLLDNARSKLTQTSISLEARDYSSAAQYLDDAKGLIDAITAKVVASSASAIKLDPVVIVIIIVIIAAAVIVIYLFLPPKPEEKRSLFDSFDVRRLRKKKEK